MNEEFCENEKLCEFDKINLQYADYIEEAQNLCITNRSIAFHFVEWLGFDCGSTGSTGLEYLYNHGLNDTTIRLFLLGYAPCDMDQFINNQLFQIDKYDLQKAGLLMKSTDESEKKRWIAGDSIIIPISDVTGNIISFCINTFRRSRPRFLNMCCSFFYDPSTIVYGLHLAKWSGPDYFILCDGYFDVMLMYQNGFRNAVMPMGSGIPSKEQARLMKMFKEEAVICCGSDISGRIVALRSAELLQKEEMRVSIAELPDGKTLSEILRHQNGREILDDILKKAKSIKEFDEQKNPWTFTVIYSFWEHNYLQYENGEQHEEYQTTLTTYVTDDEYEILKLYRENNCSFNSIAELCDLRARVYKEAYDQENVLFLIENDEMIGEYVKIERVDFE